MHVAITGTPGTGKTAACDKLAKRGYVVVDLEEIARSEGLVVGRDEGRATDEVDVATLRERLRIPAKTAILRGHYSHLMAVEIAIVLRCRPSVLRARLEARGWPPQKVQENVEAEAIDVILQQAVGRVPFVYELDTSEATVDDTANAILAILQGKIQGHEPGSIDWSAEVLSWY